MPEIVQVQETITTSFDLCAKARLCLYSFAYTGSVCPWAWPGQSTRGRYYNTTCNVPFTQPFGVLERNCHFRHCISNVWKEHMLRKQNNMYVRYDLNKQMSHFSFTRLHHAETAIIPRVRYTNLNPDITFTRLSSSLGYPGSVR